MRNIPLMLSMQIELYLIELNLIELNSINQIIQTPGLWESATTPKQAVNLRGSTQAPEGGGGGGCYC